jgi:SAM-dependent methyltransferase
MKNILQYVCNKFWAPVLSKLDEIVIRRDIEFYIQQKGKCPICDTYVTFNSTNASSLRETFVCPNCKSNPRERAMMVIIAKYLENWREKDIFESSPCDRGLSHRLRVEAKKYIPAHFYPDKNLGEMVNGFRNENLENLTFPNENFDLVITQDVLEHLFEPEKAFKEISRVLKPGGLHIFTVPFYASNDKTIVWAKKGENGEPVFLFNEEWHGNPIDSQGSACTMHYGYDIIEKMKECGNMDTIIEKPFDLAKGIVNASMSDGRIEVFVSKKM